MAVLNAVQQKKCSKPKHRKPPQRGLGVAQLEKIRLEMQQKKNNTIVLPEQQIPTTTNYSISHSRTVINPIPFSSSTAAIDIFNQTAPPYAFNGSMMDPVPWNVSHHAVSPLRNDSLELIWLPSSFLQRRRQQQQQQQQQQPSALLVKKSMSPSYSGVNLQMEPPSNQSYHTFLPTRGGEVMVGMDRAWPVPPDDMFSDSSHVISFPCKVPAFTSSIPKPDESFTKDGRDAIKFNTKNSAFREGTSSSGTFQVDPRIGKSIEENGVTMDGGFLTLGCSSLAPSIYKSKQSMIIPPSHHREYPELNLPPFQESMDGAISCSGGLAQPPFYTFLSMGPNNGETCLNERRAEAPDGINLNLKL